MATKSKAAKAVESDGDAGVAPQVAAARALAHPRDAQGDLQVLRRHGRRVRRVKLGPDVDAGLATLLATTEKA